MKINNLILELTRKCNLRCDHCLRGQSENKQLSTRYIDALFDQIDGIQTLTLSGGEPSLATKIIKYVVKKLKEKQISLQSFYIATNGINISIDFIGECLKLYALSDDKTFCSIQWSNDSYHDSTANIELLEGLSFFSKKYHESFPSLLNEGFAYDNGIGTYSPHIISIESKENFNDSDIYLNCNGDIINGCNWSYVNQNDYVLCKVEELSLFYENLPE